MGAATSHRYSGSTAALALAGQDALLVVAIGVLAILSPAGRLSLALFVAIPLVLLFGVATLHYPARVEIDDNGVAFGRYRRVHRFRWREIERIRVRRFLTGDRVLVRITPTTAFRGRYWILSSIDGFADLVASIEARAAAPRAS